jgi:hypothetical protein
MVTDWDVVYGVRGGKLNNNDWGTYIYAIPCLLKLDVSISIQR